MEQKTYENILVESRDGIGIVRLNRPSALNALSSSLMKEVVEALRMLDNNQDIRCVILTGGEKFFSAGADIKEMANTGSIEALQKDNLRYFDEIQKIGKPIIAAINGFCLGGGLELAMTCDILIAGESARLGQPEINIGVMPGAGGTQRLTRAVGKYKAMDIILSGRQMNAREAYDIGLLSRVVPDESVLVEARALGKEISQKSPLALRIAKESVSKAFETTLSDGLQFERRNFYLLMGSEDKQEGMKAFTEKRKPEFKGK